MFKFSNLIRNSFHSFLTFSGSRKVMTLKKQQNHNYGLLYTYSFKSFARKVGSNSNKSIGGVTPDPVIKAKKKNDFLERVERGEYDKELENLEFNGMSDEMLDKIIEERLNQGKNQEEIMSELIGQSLPTLNKELRNRNSKALKDLKNKNAVKQSDDEFLGYDLSNENYGTMTETEINEFKKASKDVNSLLKNNQTLRETFLSEKHESLKRQEFLEQLTKEIEEEEARRKTEEDQSATKGTKISKKKNNQFGSETGFTLGKDDIVTDEVRKGFKVRQVFSTQNSEDPNEHNIENLEENGVDPDIENEHSIAIETPSTPDKKKNPRKSNASPYYDEDDDFKALAESDLFGEKANEVDHKIDSLQDPSIKIKSSSDFINDVARRQKNLKEQVLGLSKLWNMTINEAKHWYRMLRREDKLIVKGILKNKKVEEKRKLRELEKSWKVDNLDNLEINYSEKQTKKDEKKKGDDDEEDIDFKLPPGYKNLEEYAFYNNDFDFFRHHKRTAKNVKEALTEIFSSGKQAMAKGILGEKRIEISDVRLNKSCSVVWVFWNFLYRFKLEDDKDKLQLETKKVEQNLKKSVPFLRSKLTKMLGFKFAPEIRFVVEEFFDAYDDLEKNLADIGKSAKERKEELFREIKDKQASEKKENENSKIKEDSEDDYEKPDIKKEITNNEQKEKLNYVQSIFDKYEKGEISKEEKESQIVELAKKRQSFYSELENNKNSSPEANKIYTKYKEELGKLNDEVQTINKNIKLDNGKTWQGKSELDIDQLQKMRKVIEQRFKDQPKGKANENPTKIDFEEIERLQKENTGKTYDQIKEELDKEQMQSKKPKLIQKTEKNRDKALKVLGYKPKDLQAERLKQKEQNVKENNLEVILNFSREFQTPIPGQQKTNRQIIKDGMEQDEALRKKYQKLEETRIENQQNQQTIKPKKSSKKTKSEKFWEKLENFY